MHSHPPTAESGSASTTSGGSPAGLGPDGGPPDATAGEPAAGRGRDVGVRWLHRLRGVVADPRLATLALGGTVALGVVLRFVTNSELWLDEALSVNIASLDVGDMLDALRRDGHPPLYYLLLHYWMEIVGDGEVAVRALSGLLAVASLPLVWVAARRLAGGDAAGRSATRWALVLAALSPYWIRYGTEARMYALIMLLVLVGYLLLDDALGAPRPLRLVGLAAVSGALLLTHYWAFWLVGSVGLLLLARWWRRPADRPVTGRVVVAVAAGGLLFLPWLPDFLYQARHTGTPWAGPVRPLSLVRGTLQDLGGGAMLDEAFGYAVGLVVLCLLALFVVRSRGREVTLDLRTRPGARVELGVVALTAGAGCAVAYLTGATYQSRYAAVFVPLLLLAAAYGLSRLPGASRFVVGGSMVLLSLVGVAWSYYYQRTQASDVGAAVADRAEPGDVVLYCPDQLGPAFTRTMPDDLVEVTYPELAGPRFVNWVDYAARNTSSDPRAIAAEMWELASGADIFVVWNTEYETFGDQCQRIVNLLVSEGRGETLVTARADRFYEPGNLTRITP